MNWRRAMLWILCAVSAFLGVWIGYTLLYEGRLGQPRYTVTTTTDGVELRRYAPFIIASTAIPWSTNEATTGPELNNKAGNTAIDVSLSRGFRVLAGYIFGGNQPGERLAMTAPVLSTAPGDAGAGKRQFSLSFILPHKFTEHTAPAPLDDRIALRSVPARTVAVHFFSGNCPEDECSRRAQVLRSLIQRDGYRLHPSLQVRPCKVRMEQDSVPLMLDQTLKCAAAP